MLHKFFDSIRAAGHSSGFDVYYMGLQKEGVSGTPSVEEAQQDYWRFTRSKNQSWFLFPPEVTP